MSTKLKIALMSYPMDNRKAKGTALYTRKLVEGLLQNNTFDYSLVHFEKVSDPVYEKANEILMPRVRLPYGSRFISMLLFFWKYRNDKFDIIHWFQPRVYPFYWLAPAKKIIVTMHGAGDISAPQNFIFSRFVFNIVLKYFHNLIDKVIVVSEDAKMEVVKFYNFEPSKVVSIYNGGGENYKEIDKNEARTTALKYGIKSEYILDISRFIPHKNVVGLIKAYVLLRKKYPEDKYKLVVVGGGSNPDSEENILREKTEFKNDIIFVDFVESNDLNAIYSAAELFVFPSLSEGFGLPVLEAMASGVPVVTSNVASMGEIGGHAVLTVDPLDIGALADMIHNTLADHDKLKNMRDLGLIRSKEFTWGKMVEKTEDLYRQV